MTNEKIIDHLFRHQYGKMVSILTRIFGFSNLETIEDAVQDTFLKATHTWKDSIPENPEAWLTQAAKNRTIDLFRKIKADKSRIQNLDSGPSAIALNELFLDNEIEDSQLRMIFACCHPELQSKDQIAFALKTISGFSQKEIAASLLTKEESIKKRLQRARKTIIEKDIKFEIPSGKELSERIDNVLQVIYLIFNEGFHSNGKNIIIRKDLCGEALRLCKMILAKETLRDGSVYSLFALLCFNSSRLETKVVNDDPDQNKKLEIVEVDPGAGNDPGPVIEIDNTIYRDVDVEGTFTGGEDKLREFVNSYYKMPRVASELGISGMIFIQFVVEKNGKITNIEAIAPKDRQLGYGLEEECKRVIELTSGNWKPASRAGKPVRSYWRFPFEVDNASGF